MAVIEGNYYIDNELKRALDYGCEKCMYDNDDFVIVIDGHEGAGKSKLARQIGYYCGKRTGLGFSLDNVHFHAKPYVETAIAKKGQKGFLNLLDESSSSLYKRRSMSSVNVQFTGWFTRNRSSNQIHILLLPAVHDLDNYITLWRMSLLINVHKKRERDETRESGWRLKRGNYVIYRPEEMQTFIKKQHKYGRYTYPRYNKERIKQFGDYEVLPSIEAYDAKKDEWERRVQQEEPSESDRVNKIRALMVRLKQEGVDTKEIAQIAGYSVRRAQELIREGRGKRKADEYLNLQNTDISASLT